MANLITRFLAILVTYGGVVALVFQFHKPGETISAWAWVVIAVSILAGVAMMVLDFRVFWQDRARTFSSARAIRDYMYKWIEGGGRVTVSSRDLSWVDDGKMKELLVKKAAAGELQLYMPEPIPIGVELSASGADVSYYGAPPLRSRFTIIHCERSDAAVAIGRSVSGTHRVVEYSALDDEPAFWLAQDLASVLSVLSKRAQS